MNNLTFLAQTMLAAALAARGRQPMLPNGAATPTGLPPRLSEAWPLLIQVGQIFNPDPVLAPTGTLVFAPGAVTQLGGQLFRTTEQLLQAEGALSQALALMQRLAARVEQIEQVDARLIFFRLSILTPWLEELAELLRIVSLFRQNAQRFGGRQVFERQTLQTVQNRALNLAFRILQMGEFLTVVGVPV